MVSGVLPTETAAFGCCYSFRRCVFRRSSDCAESYRLWLRICCNLYWLGRCHGFAANPSILGCGSTPIRERSACPRKNHQRRDLGTLTFKTETEASKPSRSRPSAFAAWTLLLAIFAAVQLAALFTPPLLDDADANHAEAAQHIAESGDWVTLKINGIRYLEKPPLPYWIDAALYRVFGQNTFATHLPNSLALLGCAWIAWLWANRAWGGRAALYSALAILTAIGPFLYTRFAIPEALLSFLFLLALYCFLTGMESRRPGRFYVMWAALALATLTKGLIAPVFFAGAAIPLMLLSGQWRRWLQYKPFSGLLLFLADCGSVARSGGVGESRPGTSGGQPSHARQCARLLVLLLRQRAFSALFGRAISARLQQAAVRGVLAAASGVALSVEPISTGDAGGGVAYAAPVDAASAPRCRTDGGFLSGPRSARRRGYVCAACEVSRTHDLAAELVLGLHAVVLQHFDESGVLHVPVLAAVADSDRGRGGDDGRGQREWPGNVVDGVADGRAGCVCSSWSALRRWRLGGVCGSLVLCRLLRILGRCSRIAPWAITRFRCRTCST